MMEGDGGVGDGGTALIEYAGGIRGVVDVRWNSRMVRDQFRIVGTDGELNLDPLSGPGMRIINASGSREESWPAHANVHYPIVHDFVNAVLDGSPPACPGSEAIQVDWVTERVPAAISLPR